METARERVALPGSPLGQAAAWIDWRVPAASRRLLLLDYDGTLAPFRVARDAATPYPGVREAIEALLADGQTRVVLVSGRAAHDIPALLGVRAPLEIWGSHGAERLPPDGGYTLAPLPRGVTAGLAAAARWADDCALDERFERKPAAVALHWRDLSARAAESLRAQVSQRWSDIARESGLELRPFDGGLELRAPGLDKGAVVRQLLDEAGDDVAAAFLGDDLTDEDAFAAIAPRGLGVLVRDTYRPTHAALWLRPPGELIDFLRHWRRATDGPGAPAE